MRIKLKQLLAERFKDVIIGHEVQTVNTAHNIM